MDIKPPREKIDIGIRMAQVSEPSDTGCAVLFIAVALLCYVIYRMLATG